MQTLLLSLLWENDSFKAYFTNRAGNNANEYLWFSYDKDTQEREHWSYTVEDDLIHIEFDGVWYHLKELKGMKKYDIAMIQWTDTEDPTCYMNWEGKEIPESKGSPYILKY